MSSDRNCSECGERLKTINHRIQRTFDGRTLETTVAATRCPNCKEPQVAIGVLMAFDREVVRHLAALGPIGGEAFRFLRESASLTGQALAELLGVRRETISRWEHGRTSIDRGAWVALGALALENLEGRSETSKHLKALGQRTPRRVHLDVAA